MGTIRRTCIWPAVLCCALAVVRLCFSLSLDHYPSQLQVLGSCRYILSGVAAGLHGLPEPSASSASSEGAHQRCCALLGCVPSDIVGIAGLYCCAWSWCCTDLSPVCCARDTKRVKVPRQRWMS